MSLFIFTATLFLQKAFKISDVSSMTQPLKPIHSSDHTLELLPSTLWWSLNLVTFPIYLFSRKKECKNMLLVKRSRKQSHLLRKWHNILEEFVFSKIVFIFLRFLLILNA